MLLPHVKGIYIINNKAASTSIIRGFDGHQLGPSRSQCEGFGPDHPDWPELITGYEDWTIFSAVRNPYTKAVSGWQYLQLRKGSALYGLSLEEALERESPKQKGLDWKHFYRPQTVRLYYGGELQTDILLRVETLNEDFKALCARLRVPYFKPPRHKKHSGPRHQLSKAEKCLIEDRFAEDFINFDY